MGTSSSYSSQVCFFFFFFFSEELLDEHIEFTDSMVFADQTPVLSGGLPTAPI